MKPGDEVLLRQKKTTTSPPFDPNPYKVVKVAGKRVTAKRKDRTRIRDKNHIKVVPPRAPELKQRRNTKLKQRLKGIQS